MTKLAIVSLLFLFVTAQAYVRYSPSDPAIWHVDPSNFKIWAVGGPWGKVVSREGGAILRLPAEDTLLTRLDTVALATPRTTRLAGSVAQGRITWITRSAFWGFPDYTTAEMRGDGLYLNARLRFGKSDMRVNAARLQDWLGKL